MQKISDTTRLIVYKRDGFKCVRCKSSDNLTLDHITPRSKGGGDALENLCTMCEYCNKEKGNYHPTLKDRVFSWIFTRKEANTLKNELMSALSGAVGNLKTDFNKFLEEDGKKQEKKIIDNLNTHKSQLVLKVQELLKEYKESITQSVDIKLVGMENKLTATSPPSVERSERLLEIVYLLADRVEAMEKYHGIQFFEEENTFFDEIKEYRKSDGN